jgi:competence protein ComEC
LPLAVPVAIAMIVGVCLNEWLRPPPVAALVVFAAATVALFASRIRKHASVELILLLTACALFGAARSTMQRLTYQHDQDAWSQFAETPAVQLRGKICSLPTVRTVPSRDGSQSASVREYRTAFLFTSEGINLSSRWRRLPGTLRVFIDGDATSLIKWGDRVDVIGQLRFPEAPANPGELDYATFSRRQSVCGMLFVKHPLAATVVQPAASWDPRYWLSVTRRNVSEVLQANLSAANWPLAEALLLGNRGFLSDDTEFEFITSGTMHLLAISGLHVGILYLFLVRVLLVLKARHQRALFAALAMCVAYAFLTDLRPSVLRAVVFIGLHVFSQQVLRTVSMKSLLAVTSIIFVAYDPSVVFNGGAWLSFLAVAALSRVTVGTDRAARSVPEDAISWTDELRQTAFAFRKWLSARYRQMLAVSVVTAPLVASQFHVMSAAGLIINVLLIPLTCGLVIIGFISVAWGILIPIGFQPAAILFDWSLTGLRQVVQFASSRNFGSATVMDPPVWLMVVTYSLLAVAMLRRRGVISTTAWIGLAVLFPLGLSLARQTPVIDQLRLTVLSVGHGNAVVMEVPGGDVFVFDAGALNRADRTAEIVCRFLWSRGYRMVTAVIVSHPDLDHYNGVEGILRRMVVGRLIVSTEFARSDAPGPARILDRADDLNLPITIAATGDTIAGDAWLVRILQASTSPSDPDPLDDNDASLVCIVTVNNTTVCLPGDVEDHGQQLLANQLTAADVLICPHHGSPNANTSRTAAIFQPQDVVVSSRDPSHNALLQSVYGTGVQLWSTSESGAIGVELSRPAATVSALQINSKRAPVK